MKMRLLFAAVLTAVLLTGCTPADTPTAVTGAIETSAGQSAAMPETTEQPLPDAGACMAVSSSGITDGVIDPEYGNKGICEKRVPVVSLPLDITGAPEGTVCFAVYMDDEDSLPLCGYRWVHWMGVNITQMSLPPDFSRLTDNAVQGTNDYGTVGYAGPAPPDKSHTYVIKVYALNAELKLSQGFSKGEFEKAIEGHVLETAVLEGLYRKQI